MKRLLAPLLFLSACATTGAATAVTAPQPADCPATEPATTDDAQLLWNARVEKVCVLGAEAEEAPRLLELVKDREGQQLSPEWITDELRDLVGTGFVREVKAIASPAGQHGAVLTFVVKQYPQVGEVKFVAGGRVDVGPSREAAMKTVWASPVALARVKEDLVDTLHAQGFASAEVTMKTVDAGAKTNVELVVTEGPQDTVTAIHFVGNKRVTEAELRKALRSALQTPWDVNTDVYDEQALQLVYFDRGMVSASVKASTVRESTTGAVAVTFTITEGDVFSVGRLAIRGASEKALKTLGSKTGKVFSRSVVRRDVETLEANGQFTVTPEVNVDPKKKRVDVTFVVTPK